MKYVIGQHPKTGWLLPMVFDDQLIHKIMARGYPKGTTIVSAGQCVIEDHLVKCFGRSESLKIGPATTDENLLRLFLIEGMDALQINNVLLGLTIADEEGDRELERTLKQIFQTPLSIGDDWLPTSENVNRLPEPLRKYVADLETRCDPSGDVRELTIARDTIRQLEGLLAEQTRL